jgi:ABC-type glycerol-3-phosphate transport system substrate-binding protein
MKKMMMLLALIMALGTGSFAVGQTSTEKAFKATKYYITSAYDVDVYQHYKKVGILRRGTRAQVLKTTSKWMLVRYWANGASVMGWIRR